MPARPGKKKAAKKTAKRRPKLAGAELEALRYAARCAYTLDHRPVALEELASRPIFARVGLGKLAAWAEEEGWPEERRGQQERWRARAEARAHAALMRRTERQRAVLESLHDQAVALRCQQVVQPRSWEQVASVQLKTAHMLRQWHREDLATAARAAPAKNHAGGGAGAQGRQPAAGLPVELIAGNDEEFRHSAHAILTARMRSRLQLEGADADAAGEHDMVVPPTPAADAPLGAGEVHALHADSA